MRRLLAQRWLAPAFWKDAAYDPRVRGTAFQVLLLIAVAVLTVEIVRNTAANLKAQNIASGFDFLSRAAGFDISQTLVPYSYRSSYAQAFLVGLTNTLLVAALGAGKVRSTAMYQTRSCSSSGTLRTAST